MCPNLSLATATATATYTSLLHSATLTQSLTHAKQIHAHLLKSPTLLTPSLFLLNTLLNTYCKCSDPASARKLFDAMPRRNAVSYNTLITGYLHMGLHSEAMHGFLDARHDNVELDKFTYAAALSVCAKAGDLLTGKIIHGLVVMGGMSRRVFLTNSLIGMYTKCRRVEEARRVFDDSEELDEVSWNSMVSGYEKIVSGEEALRVFVRMRRVGVRLNSSVLGSVLKACSGFDGLRGFGKVVHGCVVRVGLDLDVVVGSAMVDMYSKNGLLGEAVKFFKLMPDRNDVVFNAMITGFSRLEEETPNELAREALGLFSEMQRERIRPSKFTFSTILKAYNLN